MDREWEGFCEGFRLYPAGGGSYWIRRRCVARRGRRKFVYWG